MHFTEELFQFLWRKRAYNSTNLKTTAGDAVFVINPGKQNRDSGPDFLNARVRIKEIEWVGNVELHLKSSMWNEHGHQKDPAYDNVILHVVLEDDRPVIDKNGSALKTLELGQRCDAESVERYTELMGTLDDIPCHKLIRNVEPIKVRQWLDRMLVQRLERKSSEIEQNVFRLNGDVITTFFRALARSFGAKVNAAPFDRLAGSIPLRILMAHRNDRLQVEAMLFGMSGLLQGVYKDEYPRALQREFKFLRAKYDLTPMNEVAWKWHRIRPSGFPAVRISQLAGSISTYTGPLMEMLELDDLEALTNALRSSAHIYWKDHSQFDVPSCNVGVSMGESAARIILINTIVPFQFYMGNARNRSELKDRAMRILEELPAEQNRITRRWKDLGIECTNSADSQALIELYNLECLNKKCLFCGIGGEIIGRTSNRSKSTQTL